MLLIRNNIQEICKLKLCKLKTYLQDQLKCMGVSGSAGSVEEVLPSKENGLPKVVDLAVPPAMIAIRSATYVVTNIEVDD